MTVIPFQTPGRFTPDDLATLYRLTDALAHAGLVTGAERQPAGEGPGDWWAFMPAGDGDPVATVARHADGSYRLLGEGGATIQSGRSLEAVTQRWAALVA